MSRLTSLALALACACTAGRQIDLDAEDADGHPRALPHGARAYHFWATWCGPCRTELPDLARNVARLEQGGLPVVAAANETDWSALRAHFGAAGVPPWVVRLRSVDFPAAQRVTALPATLFLDAAGQVVHRVDGPLDWDALDPARPTEAKAAPAVRRPVGTSP